MKKVFAFVMMVTMVFALVNAVAYGELINGEKAKALVEEWASENGYSEYIIENVTNDGFRRFCGALSSSAFESEFGTKWTPEAYKEAMTEAYGAENIETFGLTWLGTTKGHDIYHVIGVVKDGERGYQKAKILFMIAE